MIVILAAAAAVLTASEADARLADIRHLYAQSCEVRAYAAFDDLCGKLKRQLRIAEKTHREAERARAKAPPVALAGNQDPSVTPRN